MESHSSCPVCHEGIEVLAVGCCDHVICYKCSSRMRVLCEQYYCPICRTDLPQVYLIQDNLKFADIPRYGYIPNRKNKIFFQNNRVKDLFDKLLENRCPLCTHARGERTFKDLQNHMRKEHTLFYCSLCIDHVKLFPSERKYYNRHDLALHRRQGDKDDSSYKGHPLCQFCDERYMDNDELYRHLRKDHFFCHFCDPEGSREFYNDYSSLRNHFRDNHYLCQEGACAGPEIRLTHAFRSRIDLQAHTTAEHANNLTKAQAKQMRTIDIDYQFAPRDRRRDRGIVTGADYEETGPLQTKVFHNSASGRGRGGRQRNEELRAFKKGNFSEEEVQKAINASLEVMKVQEKKEESQTKEKEEKEKIVNDAENFPILGNIKQELIRVDSPIDSDHKDSDSEAHDFTMAKQIALKNRRSVQHGRLISEEFPTLSGEPVANSSNSANNKTESSETSKPQVTANKNNTVTKPKSNYTNATSKGPVREEEFPGLPSKSSNKNNVMGSTSWVSKKPTNEAKQAQVTPVQISKNKTENQTVNAKNANSKVPKAFHDVNDFPSLGGQASAAGANLNWLQKSTTVEKKKPKPEKYSVDWFDMKDDFEYRIENITKKSQSDTVQTSDTKKKKKKKDKSKTVEKDIQNEPKTQKAARSLDSIASTLINDKSNSQVKEVKKVVESSPSTQKVESPKFERKEERLAASALNDIKVDENKFSLLLTDEAQKPAVEKECKKKKELKVSNDDFPALGSANPSKAPPPGFAQSMPSAATSSKKPPGFDDVLSKKRPPPGFSMSSALQPDSFGTSEESKGCSFTLKNIMPVMSEMSNFEYVPPNDSKIRNKKLIQDIMDYCSKDEGGFDQFKAVSASFRQGLTSASDYYSQCEKLIGKVNFDRIFPELLVLLPDINKQQELLTTYKEMHGKNKGTNIVRISGKSAEAPWKQTANFQSCSSCRQVLLSTDFADHTAVHNNSSDFPMLSGGSNGPTLRNWVKGN